MTEEPKKENVMTEESDWWVCICGNTPDRQGFVLYPKSMGGVPCTKSDIYQCDNCGRLIDVLTGEVIGKAAIPVYSSGGNMGRVDG